MSTAKKAITMDPNTLTTVVGTGAASSVAFAILLKLYNQFFSAKADAATSQAAVNMLNEIQEENKSLRAENNRLRADNSVLMHEKFTFQASLESAMEKIGWMTLQMEEMKIEISSLRGTIREMRNENRPSQ